MTSNQLLAHLKDRIGSHPDWPGGPVTTESCMEFVNARSRKATIGLGVRPGLRFQSYNQQLAEIAEMERGVIPLPEPSP